MRTLIPVVKCVPECGRVCAGGCRLLGVYAVDCTGPGGLLVATCTAAESQAVTPAAIILLPSAPPALYSALACTNRPTHIHFYFMLNCVPHNWQNLSMLSAFNL